MVKKELHQLVGILALQGDVREHTQKLQTLGVKTKLIKSVSDLMGINGLIIPGGESTSISLLMQTNNLVIPIINAIETGLPVLGSCAGMVLLAKQVINLSVPIVNLSAIDMTVKRNAFGSQINSFEINLTLSGMEGSGKYPAIFIRAPKVVQVGSKVQILAQLPDKTIVAVQQANAIATAFHPELVADSRIHQLFLQQVIQARKVLNI